MDYIGTGLNTLQNHFINSRIAYSLYPVLSVIVDMIREHIAK